MNYREIQKTQKKGDCGANWKYGDLGLDEREEQRKPDGTWGRKAKVSSEVAQLGVGVRPDALVPPSRGGGASILSKYSLVNTGHTARRIFQPANAFSPLRSTRRCFDSLRLWCFQNLQGKCRVRRLSKTLLIFH